MATPRRVWRVEPGSSLSGDVRIHGNKNAALPCLAASILLPVGGRLVLDHVPQISDVRTMCDILAVYGITVRWREPSTITLTRERYLPQPPSIPPELARRIRGSIVLLGALATQYASFAIAKPGGDRIGGRPITAHAAALRDLGFTVMESGGSITVARSDAIVGGAVVLTEQSVTATLMLLLYSACLGPNQRLTIADAACEPHVVTLCRLLQAMGARIGGLYSNLLSIAWPHGLEPPAGSVRLDDDFMEAGTYAIAAAVTRGDVTVPFHNAGLYLHAIDRTLGWMGVRTELSEHAWRILGSRSDLRTSHGLEVIKAEPWPRFPTDVMSMAVVLATQCTGSLKFIEYMYDDRFGFVQALRDMGARIDVQPPHAITVHGPTQLRSNELFLRPDIRSGAAMLVAALCADGTSILHDHRNVIARGYQHLPQGLAELGARITELENPFA